MNTCPEIVNLRNEQTRKNEAELFVTPILFLVFNRPDKTCRVFERIREVKPAKLFIAADGPRLEKKGESELCTRTRTLILNRIDWPCEVFTLFQEENLGCKLAVSLGISWFFEQVEEGIILEDDCLPSLSFFQFCADLLEKYRDNEWVMMISGDNFQPRKRGEASYYFSRYTHIWGWATWRRAWQKYDLLMKRWPVLREKQRFSEFLPSTIYKKAERMFDGAYEGQITTWDTQWLFTCWAHSGLSVIPNINLVSNIDADGTHMKAYDPHINLPAGEMLFPLKHPDDIKPDRDGDEYTQHYVYFRGWPRVLELILYYLWKNRSPARLPKAIKSVLLNYRTEIQRQKYLRSMK